MNELPTSQPDPTAEEALKRRLLNRIAVAAVMVVGLLGSLAMFDAVYAPSRPVTTRVTLPPRTDTPPAAEPVKEASTAVQTAETKLPGPAAEARPESAKVAKAEEKAVPEQTMSPGAPPLQALPAEKPLTRPASARPASIRPAEPVPPAASPAARPAPGRELAPPHAAQHAPASRPVTQVVERRYALQMGVFGNLANAEDLRAKLELNGIPSTIEARVHVGPFKTKEEVEAVRAKLKELGLDGGLLLTIKK